MYSRFSGNREPPVKIPEHYSGWAFSRTQGTPRGASNTPTEKPPSAFLEVAKPSPPPDNPVPPPFPQEPSTPVSVSCPPPYHEEEKKEEKKEKPPMPAPFSVLFGNMGNAFPFSHGIGFEELLIIGLLILLSRNQADTDTMLLIGLLLFCG